MFQKIKKLFSSKRIPRKESTCGRFGHTIGAVLTDHLHFTKANQPQVYCFSGKLSFCRRTKCDYEYFEGDNSAWRTDCDTKALVMSKEDFKCL